MVGAFGGWLVGYVMGCFLIPGKVRGRMYALQGFQEQESTAFNLAVREVLRDALREARIPEEPVEKLPRGSAARRRVRRYRTT